MRLIRKGPEPSPLLAFRKTAGARYGGLPSDTKSAMREALVREQHGLCCFCMQRIEPTVSPELRVKIAHWMPQAIDESRDLQWQNLFAACAGNEGAPFEHQHCDTRQGNDPLTINPLEASHVASLTYSSLGAIRSSRDELQKDIDERLNLNNAALCARRREAVIAMTNALGRLRGVPFKRHDIERAIVRCGTPDERGYLPEFAAALEAWLRRRA